MRRTIRKKDYNFTEQAVPISHLGFWSDNPRIYDLVHSRYGEEKKQWGSEQERHDHIYDELNKSENIDKLSKQIEESGGLTEPLIIRKLPKGKKYEILEGNRRFAACLMIRINLEGNKEARIYKKLEKINCEIAPKGISDSAILSLLSILHVKGKSDWSAFAKASYVKRQYDALAKEFDDEKEIKEKIKEEMSISYHEIDKMIATVNLMKEVNEKNTRKYSHYNVLNTRKEVKEHLKDPKKRQIWLKTVANLPDNMSGGQFRGMASMLCSNKTYMDKFISEEIGFNEAALGAQEEADATTIYQRVKRFHDWLFENQNEVKGLQPTDGQYKEVSTLFGKLKVLVDEVNRKLGG